jgi:hypothetical protein
MTEEAPPAQSELVHFPPLPPLPDPPQTGADPRQRRMQHVTANLAGLIGDGMQLATANTRTGFFAAAVDLGRLRAALEEGLQRFDIDVLRARWDIDVRDWMAALVMRWVQRVKELNFDLRERGVSLRVHTQDDLGYYEYVFDIFPGRPPREATPP